MGARRYGIYLLVFTFDISLVRYQCEHSKINSISLYAHVLFPIYLMCCFRIGTSCEWKKFKTHTQNRVLVPMGFFSKLPTTPPPPPVLFSMGFPARLVLSMCQYNFPCFSIQIYITHFFLLISKWKNEGVRQVSTNCIEDSKTEKTTCVQ